MTEILPVKLPDVVGANVALIVQLAPPPNVAGATGQLTLDQPKLVLAVTPIVVATVPMFFTVIAWLALVWSTTVAEKESVAGVAVTVFAPLPAP